MLLIHQETKKGKNYNTKFLNVIFVNNNLISYQETNK